MSFKNLSMAWKLAILPIIAVVALLGVYLFSANRLGVYQAKVDQSHSAQEIRRLAQGARAASLEYLRSGDEEGVERSTTHIVDIARQTKPGMEHAEDRKHMDRIIQAAKAFRGSFQETVSLRESSRKLQDQMKKAALSIEQKALNLAQAQGQELGDLIANDASQTAINTKQTEAKSAWLMTVRLKEARSAEKEYIQTDSQEAFDKAKRLIAKVRAMAAKLKKSLDEAQDEKRMVAIREAGATYRERLKEFSTQRDEVEAKIAQMRKTAGVLEEEAGTLSKAQSQERQAVRAGMQTTMLVVSLLAAALTGGLAYMVSRGILTPIRSVSHAVQYIHQHKDFSHRADVDGKDEVNQMAAAVNELIANQSHVLGDIQQQSSQVASASEELSSTSEEITQNAQASSQRVEEVSSSAQEVNNVVQDVANNISQVSESASRSTSATQEGMEQVQQAAERIQGLKSSSDRVDEIMETIQGIAKKTDLLALNAAIEAANAGEAGKGFAVVADEVRKLAEQTSDAMGQVSSIVSELQGQSDSSVQAMEGVESKMSEVLEAIQATDQVASQIAAAAEELAATMSETTDNMGEITGNVDQVASSVTQVEQAAQQLGELANTLQSHVNQFRLK